ncbi:CPBP family glutamic-type intramembrane protease, partial [Sporomusa ovata]|uniref:CPBP family glutamic-type intramembrane protease n=1 Tax=Sporomusa ovata TaxID=2378 RepID=UPI0012ECDFE0
MLSKKIFNLYELFILFSIFYIRNIIVGSFFFTSIIEEIVFRLALFNTISKKYNKVLGYLITAFLFYFIHQNPFT